MQLRTLKSIENPKIKDKKKKETSQRLPQTQIRAGSSGLEPVLRLCLVLQNP